jgi:cell fate regulator YaaT (PSP1 superfamily)
MGCGSCGSGASGKPGGCKGNGGCSTGGCNRLNVYDWLNALPLSDAAKPYPVVEVSFSKGSRKEFFRNNTHHILEKGGWFAVEGTGGYDVGQISLTGELVKLQLKKYGVRETDVSKRILHPATEEELEQATAQKEREAEVMIRSRAIARSMKLDMKLCEVEIQADSKKGTFFYTADQRVDFRELIRVFATDFKMKVEMKQIGARQESGKVGGIGSCGRELCCSTWLTDFKSVNTTAARYQNLSINQTKLSGQCGRLKCCLNYELDTYMDALSVFPDHAEHLETVKGVAHLAKKDIFKNLMWYSYSDNNKQYPLSIVRVREIQKLNKLGQKADDLQPVELETRESKAGKTVDMGFVNDVGQITLKNLEKSKKKKHGTGNKSGSHNPEGRKPDAVAGAQPQTGGELGGKEPGSRPQGNRGGGKPQGPRTENRLQGPRPEGAQAPDGQPRTPRPERQSRGPRPEGAQVAGPDGQPQTPRPERQARPQGNRPQGRQQQNKTPDVPGTENQPANPDQAARPNQPKQQGQNRPPRPPRPEQAKADGATPAAEGATEQSREPRPPRPNRNRPNRPRPDGPRPEAGAKPEGGASGPVEGA